MICTAWKNKKKVKGQEFKCLRLCFSQKNNSITLAERRTPSIQIKLKVILFNKILNEEGMLDLS